MRYLNVHIYPSTFSHETRILKEVFSLSRFNLVDRIIIASIWDTDLKEEEWISQNVMVKRFKLFFYRKNNSSIFDILKYFEFYIRVIWFFRKEKPFIVNCHSLLVLFVGYFFKRIGIAKYLIYDAHELETERARLSVQYKKILKILEKKLIPSIDKLIVVSDPIAQWYNDTYSINNISVIRNFPNRNNLNKNSPNILKEKFNLGQNDILFIYQGLLTKERGVDFLIYIFTKVNRSKHIVFLGYGESEILVKEYSKVYSNIHYHEPVSFSNITTYTSSADVGINFIPGDICLSYQFSLPNKFGEYILSGLPIVVSSNLKYMSDLIIENSSGWSIPNNNIDDLIDLINKIDKIELCKLKLHVEFYSKTIGWEFEEHEYKKIYNQLF